MWLLSLSPVESEHVWIFCLLSDLMERSLGVNTFQLAKKLVDKVISVRYCGSTAHSHFQAQKLDIHYVRTYALCVQMKWLTVNLIFTFCHLKH